MKFLLVSVFLIIIQLQAHCQDFNLTQFYASPLYLNPAFTGAVEQYRLSTTYRNQWVQVPQSFQTNVASFDYNLQNQHSGIGALVYNDRIGAANLSNLNASLLYSYSVYTPNQWVLRLGLQLGYSMRNYSLAGFTFGDELEFGVTEESVIGNNAGWLDLGTGFALYNKKYWFGAAITHLTKPSIDKIQQINSQNGNKENPMKIAAHAGAKLKLGNGKYLSPTLLYQRQFGFQQFDIGVNYLLQPLVLGIRYRGLPILKNEGGNINQESIAALTGIRFKTVQLGYSYDFNLNNRLRGNPGGSHEISLVIEPKASREFKRKYKGKTFINCPAFYQ